MLSYNETRDCLDCRWATLAEALGFDILPVPNGLAAPDRWLERQGVDGLLLSGGNDLAYLSGATNASKERDFTEFALLAWAQSRCIPVVGVCRGMQMLNHFFGGEMVVLSGHAATRHGVSSDGTLAFLAKHRQVNSFHNWGIQVGGLAQDLLVRATADDGSIEAFTHNRLPWIGIMWHPEREPTLAGHDAELIQHFFSGKDS